MGDHLLVVWLAVALLLGVAEVASVNLVFAMLAGGALAGALAAGLGAELPVQILVAAAVAALLLGVIRPSMLKRLRASRPAVTMGPGSQVGRTVEVIERVTPEDGRVKLGGEIWSARSGDGRTHEPGDQVVVVRLEGATAIVHATGIQDAPPNPPNPPESLGS